MFKRLIEMFRKTENKESKEETTSEIFEDNEVKTIEAPIKRKKPSVSKKPIAKKQKSTKPYVKAVNNRSKTESDKIKNDFSKLQRSIIDWIPKHKDADEREYQNQLVRHIVPKFDKLVTGKGRYNADILVNDLLPIEIAHNLKSSNQYDILCDQIEHYLDEFDRALVVIAGRINSNLYRNLEKRYKNQDVAIIRKLK